MNWEQELLNLYEINADKVGQVNYRVYRKKGEDLKVPYVLLPPFHTTVTAQIEVEIDEDGKFLDASAVANEDKQTIIPITEKSGSRTAGKAPHPLCDNLQYLAGDYGRYSGEKTKGAEECHALYMNALKEWHESPYTHKKVDAVYAYLKKNTLMKDLAETKVLLLDENGNLDASAKIQNIPQEKAFVRFVVRQKFAKDIVEENCWLDRTLQDAFIRYYQTMEGEKNLDYLTGKQEVPSYLHSKKIRNEGDGAKLISS
ncbi:MAG: type I-C CRISPR-associated protein Cas8c/Csd1, partial [Clostridiaceae bacterium]|nr:type I-C CRISPR-associated protein Cas8c/Csd1 [Clostridiaceae bacterium]